MPERIRRPISSFVADIREYQNYMGKAEAVDRAVTEHIVKGGELAEFLLAHRAEVVDMVLTEFDEEAFVKDIYAEGLEQGLERGLRILVASLKKFVQTPQELYALIIANEDYKDLSFDEVKALW